AGWHVSKHLSIPESIRLLPQPPHSPELNPAEHLWDEIKEKCFINKAFDSLDQVEDTLCIAINDLANDSNRLRSLTNFPYINVTL
ncbi:MAG: transposase, partial [Deltaproteobacteria bacterium]|nr:transposase [Deltaproteobacteria bacterium]